MPARENGSLGFIEAVKNTINSQILSTYNRKISRIFTVNAAVLNQTIVTLNQSNPMGSSDSAIFTGAVVLGICGNCLAIIVIIRRKSDILFIVL